MEPILARRVLGQPQAVSAVAATVRAARAGLRDPRRPLGVFLFLGPSGTGKTELAKATAEFLFGDERRLIRIDMSEFSEKHAVARLIGAPPGYVGHEEGGQLTDQVRTHPYSVVLFDELEKAHPDVYGLFLQILDEGRLTDARGRSASFQDAIVVFTSNLGSQSVVAPRRRIGIAVAGSGGPEAGGHGAADARGRLTDDEGDEKRLLDAVAAHLTPELRSRIPNTVVFRPLGREVLGLILDKVLGRVNQGLSAQGLRLCLSPRIREALLDRAAVADLGARPLEQAVHEMIELPLSRWVLSGAFTRGQSLVAELAGEEVRFDVSAGSGGHAS
jgi:ATP-dependent Clp protease ATP-binding subunit ClpC